MVGGELREVAQGQISSHMLWKRLGFGLVQWSTIHGFKKKIVWSAGTKHKLIKIMDRHHAFNISVFLFVWAPFAYLLSSFAKKHICQHTLASYLVLSILKWYDFQIKKKPLGLNLIGLSLKGMSSSGKEASTKNIREKFCFSKNVASWKECHMYPQ